MAKYRGKSDYLGAWRYAFLSALYAIPVIGLIAVLAHSFSNHNENRRHFARSYFTRLLLTIIIIVIYFTVMYFVVGPNAFSDRMQIIWKCISVFFESLRLSV